MPAQAVAFLQQHELFALERLEGDLRGAGQGVGPVAREQELVLEDDIDREVAGIVGQCDHGDVQLTGFQPGEEGRRLLFAQVHRQLREALPELWQHAREQERADGRDDPHPHLPGHGGAADPGKLHDLLRVAQEGPRPLGDLEAGRRDQHAPVGTLRDRGPERGLEIADAGAERRLRDEAPLRGAPEMPRVRQRHQVLELPHGRQAFHGFCFNGLVIEKYD